MGSIDVNPVVSHSQPILVLAVAPSTPSFSSVLFETGIRLVLGLSALGCGAFLLLSRGYLGFLVGLLGGVCSAGGVYALVRAAQCWRGQLFRLRAFVLACGAGLILGVSSCWFLSGWVQEINEAQAWRRYQQTADTDPAERLGEYRRAVPEAFQRRQAEADYLLAIVRSGRQPKADLIWTLDDLQARFGDDPTFEPVRQAIQEALKKDSAT